MMVKLELKKVKMDIRGLKLVTVSKVDLQPTSEQLVWLQDEEISLVTKNENRDITVYAIGYQPTADFTITSDLSAIQCTISETTEE